MLLCPEYVLVMQLKMLYTSLRQLKLLGNLCLTVTGSLMNL